MLCLNKAVKSRLLVTAPAVAVYTLTVQCCVAGCANMVCEHTPGPVLAHFDTEPSMLPVGLQLGLTKRVGW